MERRRRSAPRIVHGAAAIAPAVDLILIRDRRSSAVLSSIVAAVPIREHHRDGRFQLGGRDTPDATVALANEVGPGIRVATRQTHPPSPDIRPAGSSARVVRELQYISAIAQRACVETRAADEPGRPIALEFGASLPQLRHESPGEPGGQYAGGDIHGCVVNGRKGDRRHRLCRGAGRYWGVSGRCRTSCWRCRQGRWPRCPGARTARRWGSARPG